MHDTLCIGIPSTRVSLEQKQYMEKTMSENVFESLKGIDVEKEKLVESKNGLRYISWAMAWSRLCDMYPDATMEKHCNEQGLPYFKDDQGWCFTKVTVTVKGKSITEILPVLSFNNKPVQNPNSFQVNTSLMRCLAKAIALHGMGVKIYSGEDLQDDSSPEPLVTTESSSEPVTMFESPKDIKHPFSISSPTGEVKSGDDTLSTIISVFDEFLPHCKSKESVLKFWKDNKVGLALIEEKNPSEFQRLQKDFKAKKDTFN
jgi:hypothetical protein